MKTTSFNLIIWSAYHGNLDDFLEEKSAIQNGILTCPACSSHYRIQNGILHFLRNRIIDRQQPSVFADV